MQEVEDVPDLVHYFKQYQSEVGCHLSLLSDLICVRGLFVCVRVAMCAFSALILVVALSRGYRSVWEMTSRA